MALTAGLAFCLLLTGCGKKFIQSFTNLNKLQAEISKQFNEKNVHINLTDDHFLSVTFINSPLNARTPEYRAARAQETATFVKDHYANAQSLTEIWIHFVRQETHYVLLTTTESKGFFSFDKDARQIVEEVAEEEVAKSALSFSYSKVNRQTEVSIARIQLEGDTQDGVMMVPHFTVEGDATISVQKPKPPKTVGVDFASFASRSRFPGATEIQFLADQKPVHEMSEQFSTSKTSDDKYSEFVLIHMPFKAFRNWALGKDLRIKLGTNEYSLTEEQVNALQEMVGFVQN